MACWVNLKKNIYMNMNYSSLTTMYESIFAQMYIFLVEKYIFAILAKKDFHGKKEKKSIIPEMHIFGPKYFHTL